MLGNTSSLLVLALGIAVLGAAVAWRQTTQRRRVRSLQAGLDSPDPAARISAGELAVSYGLGPAARCLLPGITSDDDPAVRAAVALAVAHRQWEPAGSDRVLALRMWAADELAIQGYDVHAFGPAFTRISDMGGPQRPVPGPASPSTSIPTPPISVDVGSRTA